jgi:monothiol glutaredoxin
MTDIGRSPFVITPAGSPAARRVAASGTDRSGSPVEQVERMVRSAEIFVFMKGSPSQPACGFSASTVAILDSLGVAYSSFDVLSDDAIRSAAKQVAQWPTFPQVWLCGELVGGNDIVTELHQSGELARLLGVAP